MILSSSLASFVYSIDSNPFRNGDNFCSLLPTPYSLLPAPCSI
ncbi:hypothetical protein [Moorena sp. SIOASIH]|nr:hypothetical protein [Moorena sp. SIOASIH]